ncbi:MAG: hypothetical protein MZV65_43960 [Chromatiales bacterium]|nr:hypothetical protein [Chromatiales bacterium]
MNADQATLDVQLNYLAGGAARLCRCKLRSVTQQQAVQFADYDDFVFANGDVEWARKRSSPGPGVSATTSRTRRRPSNPERRSPAGEAQAGGDPEPDPGRQRRGARHARQSAGSRTSPQDLAGRTRIPRRQRRDADQQHARCRCGRAKVIVGIKPDSWAATKDHAPVPGRWPWISPASRWRA